MELKRMQLDRGIKLPGYLPLNWLPALKLHLLSTLVAYIGQFAGQGFT